MAQMIDTKPSYNGEAILWDRLKEFLPESAIVYNNREINGREFDFCVFIENTGALIIEVKGWKQDEITVRGVDDILISGYSKSQRSPKKQARAYRFAFLNKISAKYNVSPLVFDMVCYPFITRDAYYQTRLDIVSEEQFTLFMEDLEHPEDFIRKIQMAYDASKGIPHADFSRDFICQLRQDWEPDLIRQMPEEETEGKPYSTLVILPQAVDAESLVKGYFTGIKQIIFVGQPTEYEAIVCAFDCEYRKRNIEPKGNGLAIPYAEGLKGNDRLTRAFNLEIYLIEHLEEICPRTRKIEDGCFSNDDLDVLQKIASVSSFNIQQYCVEHTSTQKNILVEAGAGTGKTFSMVSRVAFLCNQKAGTVNNIADELAMVTFTNDAADNMKSRIKQMFMNYFILTGHVRYLKFIEDTDRAHISTIHRFALDLLRNASFYTGLGTNFKISPGEHDRGLIYDLNLSSFLDEQESENPDFIKQLPVPMYELKKKIMSIADRLLDKSVDLSTITMAQMGTNVPGLDPISYFNELIEQVIIPSEQQYAEACHLGNSIDLKECIVLLNNTLDRLGEKLDDLHIRYLFVDEFQDTDDVQIQVFQKLQKAFNAQCYMFVVGDLKQSIYRFRGAKLSAFEQIMKADEDRWNVYHLTRNYRTDKRLLALYDRVFMRLGAENHLPYGEEDRLVSDIEMETTADNLLVSIPCHAKDEQRFFTTVVDAIKHQEAIIVEKMKARRLSESERTIALLVRNNWQVEKMVHEARSRGVKLDTKSGGDLFQIEPTLDFYKLVLALNNCVNPLLLINFIESNYTDLSLNYANYQGLSENEIAQDLTRVLDEFFVRYMGKKWMEMVNEAYTQPILFVLKHIFDALKPWQHYSRASCDQKYYIDNYNYLLERIIKYARVEILTLHQIEEYLRINIITGQKQPSRPMEETSDGVQLLCTTIHKSKGLEYGTVILPFTNDDISNADRMKLDANYAQSKLAYTVVFDNKMRQSNSHYSEAAEVDEQVSEESRILYVALTRAICNCIWFDDQDHNPAISWAMQLEDEYVN